MNTAGYSESLSSFRAWGTTLSSFRCMDDVRMFEDIRPLETHCAPLLQGVASPEVEELRSTVRTLRSSNDFQAAEIRSLSSKLEMESRHAKEMEELIAHLRAAEHKVHSKRLRSQTFRRLRRGDGGRCCWGGARLEEGGGGDRAGGEREIAQGFWFSFGRVAAAPMWRCAEGGRREAGGPRR